MNPNNPSDATQGDQNPGGAGSGTDTGVGYTPPAPQPEAPVETPTVETPAGEPTETGGGQNPTGGTPVI